MYMHMHHVKSCGPRKRGGVNFLPRPYAAEKGNQSPTHQVLPTAEANPNSIECREGPEVGADASRADMLGGMGGEGSTTGEFIAWMVRNMRAMR